MGKEKLSSGVGLDGKGLSQVAGRYYALRGLFSVPTGALLLGAGLFNMPPVGAERVTGPVVIAFWAFVAVACSGYFLAARYYNRNFGRIDPSNRTKMFLGIFTVLSALALVVGIIVDSQAHLPVTLYGAFYAISMLAYYWSAVGFRPYHWAVFGGLALLCLAPVWGGTDFKVHVAMIPMGIATILVGLFDHRELLQTLRRTRSSGTFGDVNASA